MNVTYEKKESMTLHVIGAVLHLIKFECPVHTSAV